MASITRIDSLHLLERPEDERRRLLEEVYEVQAQVFDGKSRDDYVDALMRTTATHVTLYRMRNDEGRLVGYNLVQIYDLALGRRPLTLFRADAGIEEGYRGNNLMPGMAIRDAFRYRLRRPWRLGYFVTVMVHPSVYYSLAKVAHQIYPNPGYTTPSARHRDVLAVVRATFELTPVDGDSPWLVHASRSTRETDEERRGWAASDKAPVRFFRETNPRYAEREGLLTLLPITLSNIVASAVRHARQRRARRKRR